MAYNVRTGTTVTNNLGSKRGPQGATGLIGPVGPEGPSSIGGEWQLKTASFTAEPNGKYIISGDNIVATAIWSEDGDTAEFYYRSGNQLVLQGPILGDLFTDQGSFITRVYDSSSYLDTVFKDALAYATAAQGVLADSAVQPGSTILTDQIFHVRQEETSGTNGGSSVIGANTRVLNTVLTNNITGASVAANVVTLPAGTYLIEAEAPAYLVGTHQLYLHNDTDTSNAIIGRNGYTNTSAAGEWVSLRKKITIASPKAFTLRHWTQKAKSANGLGVQVASGLGEVYSDFMATKLY